MSNLEKQKSWIYLSPHFDDVSLSCGGLVWEQSRQGVDVRMWTVCAGKPAKKRISAFAESLHQRWGTGTEAITIRRAEDEESARRLGARTRYFGVADAIYRSEPGNPGVFLYAAEEAIFGELHPAEGSRIQKLAGQIDKALPKKAVIVCPLALGNHVDHQLTRRAVERVNREMWYYADYPYVLKNESALENLRENGWREEVSRLGAEAMEAWADGVAAYRSQISSFWKDEADMREQIGEYLQKTGGVALWKAPERR